MSTPTDTTEPVADEEVWAVKSAMASVGICPTKPTVPGILSVCVDAFTLIRSPEEWEAWRQQNSPHMRDKETPGEYPVFVALDGQYYTHCLARADVAAMLEVFDLVGGEP